MYNKVVNSVPMAVSICPLEQNIYFFFLISKDKLIITTHLFISNTHTERYFQVFITYGFIPYKFKAK
jgi:hypothetical protein